MRSGGVYAATFWRRTRADGAVDGAATHFRQKLLRLPDQLKLNAYVQTPVYTQSSVQFATLSITDANV